jgi:hypothetical protein
MGTLADIMYYLAIIAIVGLFIYGAINLYLHLTFGRYENKSTNHVSGKQYGIKISEPNVHNGVITGLKSSDIKITGDGEELEITEWIDHKDGSYSFKHKERN